MAAKPAKGKASAKKSDARQSGGKASGRGKAASADLKVKAGANGKLSFMGWRRENGRVGVRNHVLILPLDDLSNAACEAVANNVKGTMAIPHAYGRLQFGEDLELHFRTLIGTGSNPNVAAVVVDRHRGWLDRYRRRRNCKDRKARHRLRHRRTRRYRHHRARPRYEAKKMVQWASELQREECDISDLWVSTKCGESRHHDRPVLLPHRWQHV